LPQHVSGTKYAHHQEYNLYLPHFGGRTWKAAWVVATSSEQCTLLAAQRYTNQATFQVWSPKAEVTICTSDDGRIWCPKNVEAIKLHILSHLVGSLPFKM
jgi:hypothetical protein